MRKYISVMIIFILLTSISINIFAENVEYDGCDNECVNEHIIENTAIDNHNCDSCRIPNLTTEAQEQLQFFDPSEATYYQESSTFLNTYATYYFLKLEDNIPDNFRGSCSYVAATMLLSFYDTYWDGNIIDDAYEEKSEFNTDLSYTKSPSTKTNYDSDIISAAQAKFEDKTTFTDAEYYEVLKDLSETDLQRKLIKIAVEEHIDGIFEYFSLFPHEVKSLLEYYFYTELGFSSSDVTVELVLPGITDIKGYAIEKVKQGIPVFVSAASSLTTAHSFIIYDYDEANDELYCHMGGESNKTHVSFSTIEYQVFEGAVTVEFNTEHRCSNNYTYTEDGIEKSKCSCYFPVHPEHEHEYKPCEGAESMFHIYDCGCIAEFDSAISHNFTYIESNSNEHIKKCTDCGYEIIQSHALEYTNINDVEKHYESCTICTYEGTYSHNYTCAGTIGDIHTEVCDECGIGRGGLTNFEFTSIDANSHSVSCPDCDWLLENEEHNFRLRNYDSTHHEKYCVDCGYSCLAQHSYTDEYEYWNTDMHKAYCACGAEILMAHSYQVQEDGELQLEICTYCKLEQEHVHSYTYHFCKDGKTHRKECYCGISTIEQCIGVATSGLSSSCSKCGQLLDGGLITPWSKEDEITPLNDENDPEEEAE